MIRSFSIILATASLVLAGSRAGAQDEPVIPVAFPESRYETEWEHSAFHREVVRVVEEGIASDFARNLVLEGVVDDAVTGPIAFVRNRETDDTYMVTKEQQEGVPFVIVSASQTADPLNTTVRITDGTESATISFDKNSVMKAVDRPAVADSLRTRDEKIAKIAGKTGTPQIPNQKEDNARSEQTDSQNREIKATLARPQEFRPPGGGEKGQSPQKALENKDRRRIIPSPK